MKHRSRALTALLALILIAASSQAQITVILHHPPPNKLRASDLWKVDLINPTTTKYDVYLHGTATHERDGLIADANSRVIPLPTGPKSPRGTDLTPVKVKKADPRYRSIFEETGTVPSGNYTICVYVINNADGTELGHDCIDITVAQFTPPILLTPDDGSDVDQPLPTFTWLPPQPSPSPSPKYSLRIVEILSQQSPIDALRGQPWFDADNIPSPMAQYPASARHFDHGHKYVWQVKAFSDRTPIGESEIWWFTYMGDSIVPFSNKKNFNVKPKAFLADVAVGGLGHSLGLAHDSTVYSWGDGSKGQLGTGSMADATQPKQIPALKNIRGLAAGGEQSLAVSATGQIWAWGNNDFGQLGNGIITDHSAPAMPGPSIWLPPMDMVAAGYHHCAALSKAGQVYTWGYSRSGECARYDSLDYTWPQIVPSLSNIRMIAAGAGHTLALTKTGRVYSWGNNIHGQLGNHPDSAAHAIPDSVPTLLSSAPPINLGSMTWRDVVQIAAGAYHSLALLSDGTVRAWGDNSSGQLGDGSLDISGAPVKVAGLTDVIAIAAGGNHSMAIRKDSTVWVWGSAVWGELGLGVPDSNRTTPVKVTSLSNIVRIACGEGQSFASESAGYLWGWGENTYGQAGVGALTSPNNPDQLQPTDPVTPAIVYKGN